MINKMKFILAIVVAFLFSMIPVSAKSYNCTYEDDGTLVGITIKTNFIFGFTGYNGTVTLEKYNNLEIAKNYVDIVDTVGNFKFTSAESCPKYVYVYRYLPNGKPDQEKNYLYNVYYGDDEEALKAVNRSSKDGIIIAESSNTSAKDRVETIVEDLKPTTVCNISTNTVTGKTVFETNTKCSDKFNTRNSTSITDAIGNTIKINYSSVDYFYTSECNSDNNWSLVNNGGENYLITYTEGSKTSDYTNPISFVFRTYADGSKDFCMTTSIYDESTGNEDVEPNDPFSVVTPELETTNFGFCSPTIDGTTENGTLRAFKIVGIIIYIAKILAPLILIILGSIDLAKAAVAGEEKATSEALQTLLRRLIIGIVIFLIPTAIKLLISMVSGAGDMLDENNLSYKYCTDCLFDPFGDCQVK